MQTIAELKEALKSYVPQGWSACEGFFATFDGQIGGDHVSISPDCPRDMKYKERCKKFGQAVISLKVRLRLSGFKVDSDTLTVYVHPQ